MPRVGVRYVRIQGAQGAESGAREPWEQSQGGTNVLVTLMKLKCLLRSVKSLHKVQGMHREER